MAKLTPTQDDLYHFATYAKSTGREIENSIKARIVIERAVIRHAVSAFIAAGCTVTVDYGGEEGQGVASSTDLGAIMKAIGACDEEWLHVRKDGKALGTVMLVYGNDGWDVIADNHMSLEPLLEETTKYAETLS